MSLRVSTDVLLFIVGAFAVAGLLSYLLTPVAIRIARHCGVPLKLAAKIDRADRDYYDETIKPMMNSPLVEYVGEINDHEKSAFLSGAIALLVPIDWPEPFGLVMIEAMACGTPVVAFNRGSVPEVIDEGVTGFIVEDEIGAVAAVQRLSELSNTRIREVFDQRFTARRMAQDYLAIYEGLQAVEAPKKPAVLRAVAN